MYTEEYCSVTSRVELVITLQQNINTYLHDTHFLHGLLHTQLGRLSYMQGWSESYKRYVKVT